MNQTHILEARALAFESARWWQAHASALHRSRQLSLDKGEGALYLALATPHALAERRACAARGEWERIKGNNL